MAIRFNESDARSMGRNTSGVKGINLGKADELVGMVVADPESTLLTATENGYGKRTNFGPNSLADGEEADAGDDETSSSARYRTQRRGGKGVRDIKATARNGKVIGVCRVGDDDEVMLMTSRGKLQRIRAADISVIGRNTQGVRIMSLDEGDTLTAVVRVPKEEGEEVEGEGGTAGSTVTDATDDSSTPDTPSSDIVVDDEANSGDDAESGTDDES